jgi:hypothetical protein
LNGEGFLSFPPWQGTNTRWLIESDVLMSYGHAGKIHRLEKQVAMLWVIGCNQDVMLPLQTELHAGKRVRMS